MILYWWWQSGHVSRSWYCLWDCVAVALFELVGCASKPIKTIYYPYRTKNTALKKKHLERRHRETETQRQRDTETTPCFYRNCWKASQKSLLYQYIITLVNDTFKPNRWIVSKTVDRCLVALLEIRLWVQITCYFKWNPFLQKATLSSSERLRQVTRTVFAESSFEGSILLHYLKKNAIINK